MSGDPRIEELEEQIDGLESRVRLLTLGFVLAPCLGLLAIVPGLAYVVLPIGAFILVTVVIVLIHP